MARKSGKESAAEASAVKRAARNASRKSAKPKRLLASILPYVVLVAVLAVVVNYFYLQQAQTAAKKSAVKRNGGSYLSRKEVVDRKRVDIPCWMKKKTKGFVEGCHQVGKSCGRAVKDQFVTPEEVMQLREIAEIGMTNRSKLGGPTIMDVNTGYVKDGQGLVNIYQSHRNAPPTPRFTAEQFVLYRRVIEKIRLALIEEFQLKMLYFTAPTFITRIVGNASWSPADMHDEYWHPHVDKDNTQHYDYSGLLYLSDYEDEFTGGLFAFIDSKSEQIVEPARGRLMMFTSSKENLHQVRKVESGTRYVMSMWFSCDERKQFKNFLDGKMHQHFKREDQ